jgi:hypothetical protein
MQLVENFSFIPRIFASEGSDLGSMVCQEKAACLKSGKSRRRRRSEIVVKHAVGDARSSESRTGKRFHCHHNYELTRPRLLQRRILSLCDTEKGEITWSIGLLPLVGVGSFPLAGIIVAPGL